jgi:hypothetical protein
MLGFPKNGAAFHQGMMTLDVARASWTEVLDEFTVLEMLRHEGITKIGPEATS